MKWWLLGIIILLFFPFYAFILSKSIMKGKIEAIKYLKINLLPKFKEEKNDKKEK